jgi:hypothetical protein
MKSKWQIHTVKLVWGTCVPMRAPRHNGYLTLGISYLQEGDSSFLSLSGYQSLQQLLLLFLVAKFTVPHLTYATLEVHKWEREGGAAEL